MNNQSYGNALVLKRGRERHYKAEVICVYEGGLDSRTASWRQRRRGFAAWAADDFASISRNEPGRYVSRFRIEWSWRHLEADHPTLPGKRVLRAAIIAYRNPWSAA